MGQEYIIMLLILAISIIGHNMSVAYAAGFVLAIKLLGLTQLLDKLGSHGLNIGIIILTAAILVPIADGRITLAVILDAFKSPAGVVAIITGIGVAIAGGAGVGYMQTTPEIVSALIIGTIAGVFFFKGIPVGPLIAAGVVYGIMELAKALKLL